MKKNYLIINPEIAASALQNNEGDLYVFWLVAKKLDISGRGIIELKTLFQYFKDNFSIQSNWIYSKISSGENKYWRKPYGKKGSKFLPLIGIGNIIKRLSPNLTRSKPFKIPLSLFSNCSTKNIREILVSLVASRYDDFRPISIETVVNNTGLSESAVRNAIKNSNLISVHKNFEMVAFGKNLNDLMMLVKHESDKHKIVRKDDGFVLLRQIPNSYILNDFERLPLCTRPKELKKIDKILLAELAPSKYHMTKDGLQVNSKKIYSIACQE